MLPKSNSICFCQCKNVNLSITFALNNLTEKSIILLQIWTEKSDIEDWKDWMKCLKCLALLKKLKTYTDEIHHFELPLNKREFSDFQYFTIRKIPCFEFHLVSYVWRVSNLFCNFLEKHLNQLKKLIKIVI